MSTLDMSIAAVGGRRLRWGMTATWWYTALAVLTFEAIGALLVFAVFASSSTDRGAIALVALGSVLWFAATVPLLMAYRGRDETAPLRGRVLAPLFVCAVCGIGAWIATDMWGVAAFAVAQPISLLDWPRGVRLRVVVGLTVLLTVLAVIDDQRLDHAGSPLVTLGFFSVIMPAMSVFSLWWWDVLVALDTARLAEVRASAAQERLRVASDVHDLQGHHLQVIALQLELADRLWERSPEQALEHVRIARTNVDEARQGTRDLARAFREIPLADEIANAADLLRAAGVRTDVTVDERSADAPGHVLGPVIRETTTNVLRHGGGTWAALSLARTDGAWRYEISNDRGATGDAADGAGLEGISRRAAEAGGAVTIDREGAAFTVAVTIPARGGAA
ncbi:MAG TPA: sensor histidine kinase [Candidatus Microbacterium stercoravium]|uniref:histidine kinase n=1 Tax=Candidatus Microbacterium stercoravium TaxID=2838697 RepID=A0A9D2H3K3_9MICO|nr:sensor histidine kinase [Candidatus Microbacterium stercoravium]